MDNLAWNDEGIRYELHNGKVVCMSPRPVINHTVIAENISHIFRTYLRGKKCVSFGDGVDLHLEDKKIRFVPDGMIICNRDIIKPDGVHGVPDLIVEILSPGTAKYDKGYKKDIYEKYGVKEYWIVDPVNKSIEVYLLEDFKFRLSDVYYAVYPDFMVEQIKEEGGEITTEFNVSVLDGLTIKLEDIFVGMF